MSSYLDSFDLTPEEREEDRKYRLDRARGMAEAAKPGRCNECGAFTSNRPETDGRKDISEYGRLCDNCIPIARREIAAHNREFRTRTQNTLCSMCLGKGHITTSWRIGAICPKCGGGGSEYDAILHSLGRSRK